MLLKDGVRQITFDGRQRAWATHMKLIDVSTDDKWEYFIFFDEIVHCLYGLFPPPIIPMRDL
jgi:hypothetical protein